MTDPHRSQDRHPLSLCQECQARCCRHVALHIDTPSSKEDYDHIRWYLLHEKVSVFIDNDNDWLIEFSTPCTALGQDSACDGYETRPRICRRYPGDNLCEYESDELPHKELFRTAAEFESWLDSKEIDWRFKRY